MLAAIAWIGGMFFFLVVLTPSFRGILSAREEIQITSAAGRRYQFVAARAMELLLLTGIWNIVARGWDARAPLPERFWSILGLKVFGFALMVGLQTWQRISMNRMLAPPHIAGGGGLPGEQEWVAIQSRMTNVTRLNLAIGLGVVFLALMLGRL